MPVNDVELVDKFENLVIDRDNAEFYRGWLEKRLVLPHCRNCGQWLGQAVPVCSSCWSFDLEHLPVSGFGRIHLLIWLYEGPPAPTVDYSTPYPVATVELDEQPGLRYTSTVLGERQDSVCIGDRVALGWIDRYGAPFPVFRVVR